MTIEITVRGRRSRASDSAHLISCNSGAQLRFSFDSEWENLPRRTARIHFHIGRCIRTEDYPLSGDECCIRVPAGAEYAEIGVYANGRITTESAIVPVFRSILDPESPCAQEPPDCYQQIIAAFFGVPKRYRSAHCLGSSSGAFLCTDSIALLMTKEDSHDTRTR
ncbi:MAG: hypothetical protein MJ065_08355 [Oscillospiraceae bacterium]|nr:hypothetical protein [Oscillospiraceae bacterium]